MKEKEESVVSLQERLAKSDAKALAAEGEVSKVCCKEMWVFSCVVHTANLTLLYYGCSSSFCEPDDMWCTTFHCHMSIT